MSAQDDYAAVIGSLRHDEQEVYQRRKHRLLPEYYASSDCEYMFTICARHHGQPFLCPALAEAIVRSLLWRKRAHGWTLYCYTLMPDHLHFIVRLPPREIEMVNAGARGVVPAGILEQVRLFKRYTTTQIWWLYGGQRALWQRSSYDRILWRQQSVEPAVYYVLNNPVRKGLVQAWEEYPYSGIVDPW